MPDTLLQSKAEGRSVRLISGVTTDGFVVTEGFWTNRDDATTSNTMAKLDLVNIFIQQIKRTL